MPAGPAGTISLDEAANEAWDAIVIGAGVAGGVAASALAAGGRRVLIVDRATFPRDKVCGCCLGPLAVSLLDDVCHGALPGGAPPLSRLQLRAAGREIDLPMRGGRVVSRACLDAALVDRAIGHGAAFLPDTLASIGQCGDMMATVQFHSHHGQRRAGAQMIIAAGGLGFGVEREGGHGARRERLWSRSRLGGAAIVPDVDWNLPVAAVRMMVQPQGYVGLARLEDGRIAVGGAFEPSFVREQGSLAEAACHILECSGVGSAALRAVRQSHWLGVPKLTRRPTRVAGRRVLLVGDAAGFVEPFTGEGMTWAIQSAASAARLALSVLKQPRMTWSDGVERQWERTHRSLIHHRQARCRLIAHLLRHPMLLGGCMAIGRAWPRLARAIVDGIHTPPGPWSTRRWRGAA